MKKYGFIFLFIILIAIFFTIKFVFVNHNRLTKVKLPICEVTMMGDSHARHTLNPDYINHSINISQDSQNIIYSYYVLKKLLKDGNPIHKVVLTYSYHSLGEYYLGIEEAEMMRRYHLLLDKEFYSKMANEGKLSNSLLKRKIADLYYIPLGISNDFLEYLNIRNQKISSFPYLGSFEDNPTAKLKPPLSFLTGQIDKTSSLKKQSRNYKYLKKTIERHFHNPLGSNPSPLILYYLHEFAKLCNAYKIQLYLVNTPLHYEYKKNIPTNIMFKVDSLAAEMVQKYKVVYLDYSNFPLEDSLFYDYDHLTTQGSIIISKELNKVINSQ